MRPWLGTAWVKTKSLTTRDSKLLKQVPQNLSNVKKLKEKERSAQNI